MEHRLKSKYAPRGLRALLLAGSAVVCADVANAEPIQPFWLMPTTLATSLGIEKTAATEQVNKLRAKVFAQQTVNLLSLDTTDADTGEDVPLPFSESTPYDAPVTLKLRSGSFDLEPSVGVKVDRLANGANFTMGNVASESVGVDATMFNGRVAVSSDFVKTIDETDTRDFRDPQLREADRSMRLSDTSRRTRFSARVIDTENLRLLVDGEMGKPQCHYPYRFCNC